jgi:hypothetical protein
VIYICYVICWGLVETGELVVRDNELDVGDNEVALSDVTEGGKLAGNSGTGTRIRLAGPGFPGMGGHVHFHNPLF